MLEPNAIIGIVGSSVGLLVTVLGLVSRSVGVHRSRQHIDEVQEQRADLRHKLRRAEDEIGILRGINAEGVGNLRREARNLIRHSHEQIKNFDRFYDRFDKSWTVRGWNYVALSAGSDKIRKYARRFETYSDWITIARLSIRLTPVSERVALGGSGLSSVHWRDVERLRDELDRARRADEEHPGRLRKLRVNKGVNLRRLERYADGLVLRFAGSNASTETSTEIYEDPSEVNSRYHPVSGTWKLDRGHDPRIRGYPPVNFPRQTVIIHDDRVYDIPRASQQYYPPLHRSRRTTSMHDDHVYDFPSAPLSAQASLNSSKSNPIRGQSGRRLRHSRSRSRSESWRETAHPVRSASVRSLGSGHDGDDERNATVKPLPGRPSSERRLRTTSSDRVPMMTSGLGRSQSVENNHRSPHRRRPSSRGNETHIRPRSYDSERSSNPQTRGRDTHQRGFQDTQRNSSSASRHRPQSRSSQSSRHTDARQGQLYRDNANIETRPSSIRRSSRSSSANVSIQPSHDSGYGSLDPDRHSSSASTKSTRRRSSSRQPQKPPSHFNGDDRSRPPIALDRAEEGVRRAEARIRRKSRAVW
ncbi:hypothetical protein F5B22DRAFT_607321 [Xylaria bambusicola]|uniref:uncharacterized protein n=1 Tax=Xylaria bambusicola TaxID=326684 RepID=UPI002007CB21|nr:uncharacterized protein F5B22DRAFT_607321 [Xylaria bambusicola]KAI0515421.1 hypothetical protein F5B22DRAFT_607321 [Xylaria bambusicola]